MKVLFVGDSPATKTRWGRTLNYLTQGLHDNGIEVGVSSTYGMQGAVVSRAEDYVLFPNEGGPANDRLTKWADVVFNPDLVVSCGDPCHLGFHRDPEWNTPWVAWTLIDNEVWSAGVITSLKKADGLIAASKYGEQMFVDQDLRSSYIPLGVKTEYYQPIPQDHARQILQFPEDRFIVGLVMENDGKHNGWEIHRGLIDFKEFCTLYPDVLLYLHMNLDNSQGGLDVLNSIRNLNIPEENWACVDQARYNLGMLQEPYMVSMYNSLDVLLYLDRDDGFGLPVLEAAACGVPTVVTHTIPLAEMALTSGGWTTKPEEGIIVATLIEAYETIKDEGVDRDDLFKFAKKYDYDKVVVPAWLKYLKDESWIKEKSNG
jgi:glycosyltransferase involved in cell wall biosynthesis